MEIGVIVSVFEWSVKVLTKAAELIGGWRQTGRHTDDAKVVLGIDKQHGVAYRHDSVHPLYRSGTLHPDNLDAVRTAAGSDVRRAADLATLTSVEDLRVSLEQNMVLLGSPSAEGLSRIIFGYEEVGGLLLHSAVPVDVPYKWQLNEAEIDPAARARRFVRGRGAVDRPNWHIISERTGGPRLFIPEVDNDGLLASDYLLVTRFRNFLTSAATDLGRYLVSFAGTHGTGTRAIDLLFSDRALLKRVAEELRGRPPSYQLLFRVADMRHSEKKGTRARSIELIDTVALPDSRSIWSSAHAAAQAALGRWLAHLDVHPAGPVE